jgi:hypothetical protein
VRRSSSSTQGEHQPVTWLQRCMLLFMGRHPGMLSVQYLGGLGWRLQPLLLVIVPEVLGWLYRNMQAHCV